MSTFFEDLYSRFHELHSDAAEALDGLPAEGLDWTPGPVMNSIGVLIAHFIGAEQYWIGVALNEPPNRDREAEFRTRGLDVAVLKQYLEEQDGFTKQALTQLNLQEIEALHISPRNKKQFSVGWALTHALEHTALHVGHIQLTRQLWEQRSK